MINIINTSINLIWDQKPLKLSFKEELVKEEGLKCSNIPINTRYRTPTRVSNTTRPYLMSYPYSSTRSTSFRIAQFQCFLFLRNKRRVPILKVSWRRWKMPQWVNRKNLAPFLGNTKKWPMKILNRKWWSRIVHQCLKVRVREKK